MNQPIPYNVPDISCDHCADAISAEVSQVAGVEIVEVDVRTKTVTVGGSFDETAIVAAIDEAGYEVV